LADVGLRATVHGLRKISMGLKAEKKRERAEGGARKSLGTKVP